MYIPKDTKTGLIEQFEGFFQLKDINLNDYEPRSRSIQAVLGMDETNQTQVLKQPDVLMLLYLLRDTPEVSTEVLQKNWDYYAPRTDSTYGSSLCPSIHAILASRLGATADAYRDFMQTALVDLEDSRGNTADGIHAASAGGVWQAVVFGFAGIQLTENGPVANPHLPPTWTRLKFKLNWHGTWHNFDLSPSVAPAPAIEGYIFDVDGVLTDTAEYHYREPSHCVVVEDATVGIEAAISGGMRSIGIGPATRVGAANIILPNLIGVHSIDLQAQLKLAPV
jgi:trehalose/maltose hydrolase-like predicted phosphorylase